MTDLISITGGCCLSDGALVCLRQNQRWPLPARLARADLPEAFPEEILRSLHMERPASPPEGGTIRHFRASRLIADCVAATLADAGLIATEIKNSDMGFVSGSYYGAAEFLDPLRSALDQNGPRGIRPTDFSIATHGYPMAALGIAYGAIGPSTAFVSGEKSGIEALAFAQMMLRVGLSSRMVVIGYELLGPQTRRHHARLFAETPVESIVCLLMERNAGARGIHVPQAELAPDHLARTANDPVRLSVAPLYRLFTQVARISAGATNAATASYVQPVMATPIPCEVLT